MYSAAVTGSASGGILLVMATVVAISVITVIFRRRKYYKGRAHKILQFTDLVNGLSIK